MGHCTNIPTGLGGWNGIIQPQVGTVYKYSNRIKWNGIIQPQVGTVYKYYNRIKWNGIIQPLVGTLYKSNIQQDLTEAATQVKIF